MQSCKDISDQASTLIDGELSTWNAMKIRLHLAMCKGCRAFMMQMRVTRALVDQAAASAGSDPADDARIGEILSRHREGI